MIKELLSLIADAIYPPKCIACDALLGADREDRGYICLDCNSRIVWLESDFFSANLKKQEFDSSGSLAAYDGAWQEVVHKFKYNNRTDLAGQLGEMLSRRIDYEYDLITAVPLHPKRLRERGYNQSALLAKVVAKKTGFKFNLGIFKRVKHSAPQVGLAKEERMENIRGAFEPCGSWKAKDADILLIDDVITTGATVNECAKVLKKAGAGRVDVMTIARAI